MFLIHLEHNTDIQVIIIHRTDEYNNIQDDNNQDNYPVLIIKNNTMTKRLEPYGNFGLNSQWKQRFLLNLLYNYYF